MKDSIKSSAVNIAPRVSAILTTARLGGFDILAHCFENQTMSVEDYEVIVVDELYEQRRCLLPSPPFVHLPPKVKTDIYNNPSCHNVAFAAARGELICILTDYCWVYPGYLEDHWAFYKENPGWSMSGYFDRYEMPEVVAFGGMVSSQQFYSAFAKRFDSEAAAAFFLSHRPIYRERKGGAGVIHKNGMIEMPGDKIYLLNDSIPREVLKTLNGMDGRLDGKYGANDIDIGMRANIAGWHFGLNPASIIAKFGMPGGNQVPGVSKKKTGTPEDAYKFVMDKIERIQKGEEQIAVPPGYGAWE